MNMMKKSAIAKGLSVAGAVTAAILFLLSSWSAQQTPSLLSAQSTSADNVEKIIGGVPFAYDLALDTISYNSCVGAGLNQSGKIHGIKFGVNEGFVDSTGTGAVKGGLKLRSDFLQYLANNVDPTFPNTTITSSQIQYILQNSEANRDLQIQFAVRTTTDLNVVPDVIDTGTAPTVTLSRDGIYKGTYLSEDPIMTSVTKNVQFATNKAVLSEGPRIYNIGTKSSPEAIEASLGYSNAFDASFPPVTEPFTDDGLGAGEEYSDNVRNKFNSFTYILAATFGNQSTASSFDFTSTGLNSPKRKSNAEVKRAFGRSYDLGFNSKNSSIPSWRKNLLTKVTEKTLDDGKLVAGASWGCDNILIMKTNQLNNKKISEPSCSELIASDLLVPAIANRVKNIRRHYTEDLWSIGLFYAANTAYNPLTRTTNPTLCLVNKQADCYLPTTGLIFSAPAEDIGVQYDPTKECYLSRFTRMGVTYIGNKTGDVARRLGRCAQYASVCIRASTSY